MTTAELILNYSPAADMTSVVTGLVIFFLIAKVLYFSKDRKFVFLKRALHFIVGGAACNVGLYFVIKAGVCAPVPIFLLRDIYHVCFLMCLYCFILYMKKMLDVQGPGIKVFSYITRIFFFCCLILDLLSPFTKFGLYLENGKWYDSIFSTYNIFYVYAVLCFMVMLLFYSKRLIRSVRICLIGTESVIALIMVYQGILNINTFTSFTYMLPVLVVLILLHSMPFDDKTGALEASHFDNYIQQVKRKGLSADYMVLKLDISTVENLPSELGKALNSFWHNSFKKALLFHMATDFFVLVVPRDNKNGNTEIKIDKLLNQTFQFYYNQYRLPYKIIGLFNVDFVDTMADITGIVKYLLVNMDENTTYIADEKKKEELRLLKYIGKQLADIEKHNNLDDERVLVYCQPIRNMETGKYDTAEALMRLSLPKVGFVMPSLFITMAEQYNHIHTLTKIMLNKVCKKIKELEKEGYQFNRISVNIAASEVRSDSFCDEILGIIAKNGINPAKIGIELTESQTESDFRILKEKMKQLREAGMTLYLDDVGTGYSNLDRIVRYDVDVVKFDRFFLLEAEKNMKIQKMITHLSQAFQDLDYKLLYEGVETEEHEALCMSCGADYIQGFKYAKPVPADELRNFFELC